MFTHHRTQGIILEKNDRGEANQLLTFYTEDYGKLEILCRAIRKSQSKLRAGADFLFFSYIEFIRGKAGKTLTDAILIEKFHKIRKNLGKLTVAKEITETLDRLTRIEQKDVKIWVFLLKTLKVLNDCQLPEEKLKLLYQYFFWKTIALLGYKPELYNCAVCQCKLIPGTLYFNPKEGGMACKNCYQEIEGSKEIPLDVIKILRFIIGKDWATVSRLKISENDLDLLKETSNFYLSFIVKPAISDS